jgi:hypothetical protein
MSNEPVTWFFDRINRNLMQLHAIEDITYSGKTRFQKDRDHAQQRLRQVPGS